MAYRHQLTRNHGHPSTREAGWDLLEVEADTTRELEAYVAAAQRKFWKVWERPTPRTIRLYKPAKASAEWADLPGTTGLGKMLAGIDMKAGALHIDLVLASMAHHVRSAPTPDSLVTRLKSALDAYGGSGKAVADVHAGLLNAIPALNDLIDKVSSTLDVDRWRENCTAHLASVENDITFPDATVPDAPPTRNPSRPRP